MEVSTPVKVAITELPIAILLPVRVKSARLKLVPSAFLPSTPMKSVPAWKSRIVFSAEGIVPPVMMLKIPHQRPPIASYYHQS